MIIIAIMKMIVVVFETRTRDRTVMNEWSSYLAPFLMLVEFLNT